MPNYDLQCEGDTCGIVFEKLIPLSKIFPYEWPQACPECGATAHRVFYSCPTFSFKEGGGAHSIKPDRFWDNAEEQRVKKQAKRRAEQKEKINYDSEYRKKVELADARKRSAQEYFRAEDD